MNSRLFIIPALAVLAVSAPALAQNPSRMGQPAPQAVPQQPLPAEAPAAAVVPVPAAAPAPAAPLPEIPKHHCVAPEYPGTLATNTQVKVFNRDYKIYGECIKQFVDQNRAWVNAVVEVNNKAVEEYNQYTVELKKAIDATNQ
jgi:hypothetical protein